MIDKATQLKLDALAAKVDALNAKVDSQAGRIEALEASDTFLREKIVFLDSQLDAVRARLTAVEGFCKTVFTHLFNTVSSVSGHRKANAKIIMNARSSDCGDLVSKWFS
jgi:chromosome segregation ATPase